MTLTILGSIAIGILICFLFYRAGYKESRQRGISQTLTIFTDHHLDIAPKPDSSFDANWDWPK